MQYNEAMEYLASFSHLGAPVQDLSRCAALLVALGNPQDRLRFVHVAGTNGKGSTLTYIACAAQAAGYRVGCFTSPFIHCYEDRIRVNGENIPHDALCRCCDKIRKAAPALPFSQFEITMAIALLWFVESDCALVCWETGIGGRLDSTNLVTPEVSVITSISLDHTAILGDTIAKIAAQKAGILKVGRPAVLSADNPPDAVAVVAAEAARVGTRLVQPDLAMLTAGEATMLSSRFTYRGISYRLQMPGAHQLQNAITALEAVALLRERGFDITTEAAQQGLAAAQISARIEVLRDSPLVLLDGGHNPSGMAALCHTLKRYAPKPVFAVIGVLLTKDASGVTAPLVELAERIFCVDGFAPNAVPAAQLATLCGAHAEATNLEQAVREAVRLAAASGGTAVLCGSLYLAAAAGSIQF